MSMDTILALSLAGMALAIVGMMILAVWKLDE
jgi:hypothetical protein